MKKCGIFIKKRPPSGHAGVMNKGTGITSGKTDIEKGMASPTNRQNRKSTAGKQQKKMRTWMCAQRR